MALRRQFQYETLLRVRARQQDLKAQALATAVRDVEHARAQRDRLSAEQRRAIERAGELARHEFDASDLRRYYQYERHLARLGVMKDAEIREKRNTVAARQKELAEARKQKRVIERLKERHTAAFLAYVRDQERKAIDEAAVVRAVLTRGNAGAEDQAT